MKKNQIKTGVVYGYQRSTYNSVTPVVVLDTERLYATTAEARYSSSSQAKRFRPAAPYENKPKSGGGFNSAIGYLAVKSLNSTSEVDIADLLSVTLEEAAEEKCGGTSRLSELGIMVILVQPRHLLGEYEDAAAKEKAEREERYARYAREDEERAALRDRGEKISESLKELGFEHRYEVAGSTIELSLEQAQAIIDAIRELSDPVVWQNA